MVTPFLSCSVSGRIAGAAIESAAGGGIGGTNAGPDIAAAGIGAGLGYGAHKAIQTAGGYGKIAGMAGDAGAAVKGRMMDALRRALAKAAQAEI